MPELESTSHEVFGDVQLAEMKVYMHAKDMHLWNFVQFMFYTYIRPKELAGIKVKHLYLDERKIFIPAKLSKNKKDGYVYMSDKVADIIRQCKIDKADRNSLVFCKSGYGGYDQLTKHDMYRKHKVVLDSLNIQGEYTLYSWKHTGVTKAYKAGIDIKAI